MKKIGILNAQLAHVVAGMGHTDRLVVCDSGLPIPRGSAVVDLALTTNIPRFLDTVKFAWTATGSEYTATDSLLGFHRALYDRSLTVDSSIPARSRKACSSATRS